MTTDKVQANAARKAAIGQILGQLRRADSIRGRYLNSAVSIEEQICDLLCDVFRVVGSDAELLRRTVLAGPLRPKIDALEGALTGQEGFREKAIASLCRRLRQMADRRDMFAHATTSRTWSDSGSEPINFKRYRNGKVRSESYSEESLEKWLEQLTKLNIELSALPEALATTREGTIYFHAVGHSGAQMWDERRLPDQGLPINLGVLDV